MCISCVMGSGASETLHLGRAQAEWDRDSITFVTRGHDPRRHRAEPSACCCGRRRFGVEFVRFQPSTSVLSFCGAAISVDSWCGNFLVLRSKYVLRIHSIHRNHIWLVKIVIFWHIIILKCLFCAHINSFRCLIMEESVTCFLIQLVTRLAKSTTTGSFRQDLSLSLSPMNGSNQFLLLSTFGNKKKICSMKLGIF